MKKYVFAVALIVMGAMPAQYAHAEDGIKSGEFAKQEIALTISALEAQRKSVIVQNMPLTAEENSTFWAVYNDYRSEMLEVTNLRSAVITDYADAYRNDSLSDKDALKLTDRYLNALGKQIKVKKAFVKKFKKALTAKNVARFYQIDNRLDQLVNMQLAQNIPLVQ